MHSAAYNNRPPKLTARRYRDTRHSREVVKQSNSRPFVTPQNLTLLETLRSVAELVTNTSKFYEAPSLPRPYQEPDENEFRGEL